MALRSVLVALALAALAPSLYERLRLLPLFYSNTPQRLAKVNALGSYEIKFADQIRSCEDVLLIEEHHLAILACDVGRERLNTVMGISVPGEVENANLWAYNYESSSKPDAESLTRLKLVDFPSEKDFHTLGMAYDRETSTLFVTNHAKAGPRIELFKLDVKLSTATYQRTIQHPLIRGPNAISLINSNEFYVTNSLRFTRQNSSKFLSLLEIYLSPAFGTIVYVNIQHPEVHAEIVAQVAFANGVIRLNSSTVAVSSTTRATLYLFNTPNATVFEEASKIRLPFLPDNLSLSAGKLLIAGHPHAPSLTKFASTRYICNDVNEFKDADPEAQHYCALGEAGSWVVEWSESGGVKHLYVDTEYPTSATAVKDAERGVGVVSGLYAKGILVWRDEK
ncbi:hypothetical protein ACJ41O_001525 [Fusarium nematophilum]